jgi:hypothetical protein
VSETIGAFTVDAAEGVLRPAAGIVKTSVDPAPPTYYAGQAKGVASPITTVRACATPGLALAEALAYRAAIGSTVTFRGVACFVADVEPDHRAAETEGGTATVTARWVLVASLAWIPV